MIPRAKTNLVPGRSSSNDLAAALRRIAELESNLEKMTEAVLSVGDALKNSSAELQKVRKERDNLRRAWEQLKAHHELLKRRIFVAKAERIDTAQLEIEFAETTAKLAKMASELDGDALGDDAPKPNPAPPGTGTGGSAPPGQGKTPRTSNGSGRQNLADANDLPVERVELFDDALEGVAPRAGFEESYMLGYRRACAVRILVARAKYRTTEADGAVAVVTAPKPRELYDRGMLAPSFIAHLLAKKYRWGMPFHRAARELLADGIRLDDSTMCRYAEHVGASLGGIVEACAAEARETAFCLSTDATGVAIQPAPLADGKRQACAKGHFFVVLADKDHVFFEYQPKHTSQAVCAMFHGFKGYIQADANAVYDALFRGEARADDGDKPPDEVGCWAHARRKFWEAAVTIKDPASREALLRVRTMFKLEQEWADLPPKQRHERRQRVTRPMLDEFFAWAAGVFERVKAERGPVATAFGYATRQREPLLRFLDDGRLRPDNNAAERALRGSIAVGRKAWLFFGSDDHATAAANIFSLVASCELHGLDVERYLAEVIRVMPLWPRDRYLELAPRYWTGTRARLAPRELERPIGHVTVPPPAAEQ